MPQMNMQQMMKQARKMQEQLEAAQAKLGDIEVSSSTGGGMVKMTATADMKVTSVTINPQALDPEDVDLLQDMILTAVNDVIESAQAAASQQVSAATGGFNIPGLM
ncbi:DNA-binding protein, YbaB/EbfC family [Coriobacteriaceae bacterium BV3Ac1]|nr:YbaB/EbfC family nucleoid-associated protein [Olegusella massiliensis]ERL13360.1 DNA-binding protein, YbaB/EbfC family [Coriobacteriaceae bacterium BV3Ac1]